MSLLRHNFPNLHVGHGRALDSNDTGGLIWRNWNRDRYNASNHVAVVHWIFQNSMAASDRPFSLEGLNDWEMRPGGTRCLMYRARATTASLAETDNGDFLPSSGTWYFIAFLDNGTGNPQFFRGTESALATELSSYRTQTPGSGAPTRVAHNNTLNLMARFRNQTAGWDGGFAFSAIYDSYGWGPSHIQALQRDLSLFHDRAIFKTFPGDFGTGHACDLVTGAPGYPEVSTMSLDPGPRSFLASRPMLVPTTRKGGFVAGGAGATITLAATLGAATLSAAAQADADATLAATLAAAGLSSGAQADVDLSLSGTLAAATLSSTATAGSDATATLTATLDAATLAATAQADAEAALTATLGAATLSAAAQADVEATLGATLEAVTLSSSATQGNVASMTLVATLDAATLSAAAVSVVDADLASTLADAGLTGAASSDTIATVSASLAAASLASQVAVSLEASLGVTLSPATLASQIAQGLQTAGRSAFAANSGNKIVLTIRHNKIVLVRRSNDLQ